MIKRILLVAIISLIALPAFADDPCSGDNCIDIPKITLPKISLPEIEWPTLDCLEPPCLDLKPVVLYSLEENQVQAGAATTLVKFHGASFVEGLELDGIFGFGKDTLGLALTYTIPNTAWAEIPVAKYIEPKVGIYGGIRHFTSREAQGEWGLMCSLIEFSF